MNIEYKWRQAEKGWKGEQMRSFVPNFFSKKGNCPETLRSNVSTFSIIAQSQAKYRTILPIWFFDFTKIQPIEQHYPPTTFLHSLNFTYSAKIWSLVSSALVMQVQLTPPESDQTLSWRTKRWAVLQSNPWSWWWKVPVFGLQVEPSSTSPRAKII